MTLEELKSKIYEDNKILFILEKLGCHSIQSEQGGDLYTAGLPDGNNKRSVQVRKNEFLTGHIRSRGIKGSLLDIVCYIKNWYKDSEVDIAKAKQWLMNICGYKNTGSYHKENPLAWLDKLKKQREHHSGIVNTNIPVLPENYFNQYIYPFYSRTFAKDGISKDTQIEFNICYDVDSDRIVIPIYDLEGFLVGFKGRATRIIDEDNKIKYIYLYPTIQSHLLFNYHRALEYIKFMNEVIVVEAEKGSMQLWEMGVLNGVGLGHKDVTPQQLKILKDLQCDIVLAYDKGISLDFIKAKYKNIGYFRNIYAVYDDKGLLKGKESPTDRGFRVWEELYNNRIKIY
ncbi:hypothetical protein ACR77J_07330 [Tissierella praeacuta]|uniref:hypothetical protein n=1 Tax=Tissierella praeacuta TaxID=43131 RepID=UPI003DA62547